MGYPMVMIAGDEHKGDECEATLYNNYTYKQARTKFRRPASRAFTTACTPLALAVKESYESFHRYMLPELRF